MFENLDCEPRRAAGDNLERALGCVVDPREMNEHEARYTGVLKPPSEIGGLLIGQVTERALDAIFETLRIRPHSEQLRTVVGLEQHKVAIRQKCAEPRSRPPEIGCDGDPERSSGNTDRNLGSVVRQSKRLDHERAENRGAARREHAAFDATTGPPKEALIMRVERHAERTGKGPRL